MLFSVILSQYTRITDDRRHIAVAEIYMLLHRSAINATHWRYKASCSFPRPYLFCAMPIFRPTSKSKKYRIDRIRSSGGQNNWWPAIDCWVVVSCPEVILADDRWRGWTLRGWMKPVGCGSCGRTIYRRQWLGQVIDWCSSGQRRLRDGPTVSILRNVTMIVAHGHLWHFRLQTNVQ